MHTIEPYFKWRDLYTAEEDKKSPFYGRKYNEFSFTNKIYNYFIHPQWDSFGSSTLYIKIIFADYEKKYACIELIGEWNDCLHNDIMYLKRNLIEKLMKNGIYKFLLIGENVLNFHTSDDSYYEEWFEEVNDESGWIIGLNFREHVLVEMKKTHLHYYILMNENFDEINWRIYEPQLLHEHIDNLLMKALK